MDFSPDDHQHMIRDAVRAWADGHVRPFAAAWDVAGEVPPEALRGIADVGLLGMAVPEAHGGLGLDALAVVAALTELATADAGLAQLVVSHGLCLSHLQAAATVQQVAGYMPRLASGQHLGTWAHGEDEANLDADKVTTRAVRDGDGWRLHGFKPMVLLANRAHVAVVTALDDTGALAAFVVRLDTSGVGREAVPGLLGLRTAGAAHLRLEGVLVEARLDGDTAATVAQVQDAARLGTAAVALGVGRAALKQAAVYSRQREQFGKAIATFQPIQWLVANSTVDLEVAGHLVQRAAWLATHGKPARQAIAMAKLSATEAAYRVADRALQLHGAYGYTTEFPVEKALRDATVLQLLHGTPALQRIRIARGLLARA